MKRFDNRVVIVTGAAQGIGAAIARRLASEGAAVAIGDINEAGGIKLAEELGAPSFAVHLDVGDEQSVADFHAEVLDRGGRIDALINNAAIVPFIFRYFLKALIHGSELFLRSSD